MKIASSIILKIINLLSRQKPVPLRTLPRPTQWISFWELSAAVRPGATRLVCIFEGKFHRGDINLTFQAPEEQPSSTVEKFLQFSCYIDKDVKYLHTGLKNRLST